MDTGQTMGLMLLYSVMVGYAVLLLSIVAQTCFRAATEKRRLQKSAEQNAQRAYTLTAVDGRRGRADAWPQRSALDIVAMRNDQVHAKLAGAPLFSKAIALVSIFIALGVTSTVAAQQRPARDVSASDLKQQLIDVEVKETQLRMRLEELDEQLTPESIERAFAGIGSAHPEKLREHRRRLLTIERRGLQAQLDLLGERRVHIEAAIAAAETAAQLSYAQPEPTPSPNPMTEMAMINLPIEKSLLAMAMLPLLAGGMSLLLIVGIKRMRRRHSLLLPLLFVSLLPAPAQSQETESITAFARGHGSMVSAVEERNISAALVVLRQNGQALITLYSDLQLQIRGTWSVSKSSPEEIHLKITGGELAGNAIGTGKLLISNDRKYIRELTITGKVLNGPHVTVRFTGDRADDRQKETNPILVSPATAAAPTAVRARSETIPLVIY